MPGSCSSGPSTRTLTSALPRVYRNLRLFKELGVIDERRLDKVQHNSDFDIVSAVLYLEGYCLKCKSKEKAR
jgi:Fe2+ or Zn2+ uptake regulation protein